MTRKEAKNKAAIACLATCALTASFSPAFARPRPLTNAEATAAQMTISAWEEDNEMCSPDADSADLAISIACQRRDRIAAKLNKMGWCQAKDAWVRCANVYTDQNASRDEAKHAMALFMETYRSDDPAQQRMNSQAEDKAASLGWCFGKATDSMTANWRWHRCTRQSNYYYNHPFPSANPKREQVRIKTQGLSMGEMYNRDCERDTTRKSSTCEAADQIAATLVSVGLCNRAGDGSYMCKPSPKAKFYSSDGNINNDEGENE